MAKLLHSAAVFLFLAAASPALTLAEDEAASPALAAPIACVDLLTVKHGCLLEPVYHGGLPATKECCRNLDLPQKAEIAKCFFILHAAELAKQLSWALDKVFAKCHGQAVPLSRRTPQA